MLTFGNVTSSLNSGWSGVSPWSASDYTFLEGISQRQCWLLLRASHPEAHNVSLSLNGDVNFNALVKMMSVSPIYSYHFSLCNKSLLRRYFETNLNILFFIKSPMPSDLASIDYSCLNQYLLWYSKSIIPFIFIYQHYWYRFMDSWFYSMHFNPLLFLLYICICFVCMYLFRDSNCPRHTHILEMY